MPVAVGLPAWEPHPDVWLIVGLAVAAYVVAVQRVGPAHVPAGRPLVTRAQALCFAAGLFTVWLASDWPIHDVAEQSMYSVHMVQHLLFSLVAAPLLLLGIPGWMLRAFLLRTHLLGVARAVCRFFPALVLFNAVLVFTHWPAVVNASLENALVHFSLHAVLLLSSFAVWMPVVSPLPEVPRLQPPLQMAYLFLQSVLPTVPASFLTFGTRPLYKYYEHVPHLWGMSTLEDQLVAGLVMKIGAGLVLWGVIAIVFFRWAIEEERREAGSRREWQALEREVGRPSGVVG